MDEGLGPVPAHRLAPAARGLWRTQGALHAAAVALVAAGVSGPLSGWDDRPGPLMPLLWGAVLALAVWLVALAPELRWRRWRYEVRPEEIDIRQGLWAIRRTLVPMVRVQHVDTESGLLQQGFGLATVSFHTAAGQLEIPQLTQTDAAAVRDRIAELSRAATEDV